MKMFFQQTQQCTFKIGFGLVLKMKLKMKTNVDREGLVLGQIVIVFPSVAIWNALGLHFFFFSFYSAVSFSPR